MASYGTERSFLFISSARDDLVKVSGKSGAWKCQNQLTPPYFDQLSERHQLLWAGPSPPLIWTKSKRTAAFFRETFPSSIISAILRNKCCYNTRVLFLGRRNVGTHHWLGWKLSSSAVIVCHIKRRKKFWMPSFACFDWSAAS